VTDLTKLCDLLGPGDFAAVGIAGASAPTVNSDGPGSAYCVYAGKSAGTGGIEFDAFVDDDAAGTYQTILDEIGPVSPLTIPGVDEAGVSTGTVGQADKPASVIVRIGKLTFTIAAPAGADTVGALTKLAALVITRAVGITA
jgi:hypothetical protein